MATFIPNVVKVTSYVFLSLSTLLFLSRLSSSPFPFTSLPSLPSPPSPSLSPPPSHRNRRKTWILPPLPPRLGLIDESGAMTSLFQVFDEGFDSSGGELEEEEEEIGSGIEEVGGSGGVRVRVSYGKFRVCEDGKRDYVPCLDNVDEIVSLNLSDSVERFERHCPKDALDCLVPVPKGYQRPILWPQSRDEVWFNNVPHPRLVEDKGGQNWIAIKNDKVVFPGGGTEFINGADQYLDQISQMVPDIAFGHHTRVALDIGCGVASFGAFLFQRNVTTLSIAPKDVHENQIQLALERGVPAMISVFAKHRLPYPSQAFDLMHCSRCRIDWTRGDGVWLLEANRMLRAGGYFVWAAQPVDEHEDNLQEQWKDMQRLTAHICWELVKKDGYIAIWRKPEDNSCYLSRDTGEPPLCELHDDPDNVWYINMTRCITRLPENGYGSNVSTWPARLNYPPDRLQSIKMDAYISRNELFKAESNYWKEIVESYIAVFRWREMNFRNVMDMRAGFGGFAAALHDFQIDCWVMNVVPVNGFNYLPVIYDRGLIGVIHDWCEPFDTYPRTYDLLHAAGLFSVEQKRNKCHISTIMVEMDRMLRPGGTVYIRDTISVVDEILDIAIAMGWMHSLQDTGEGPHASWKILICDKPMP